MLCVCESAIHSHLKRDYVHRGDRCVCVCSTREHAFINRTDIQCTTVRNSETLQSLRLKGPLVEEMHVDLFSKRAAIL